MPLAGRPPVRDRAGVPVDFDLHADTRQRKAAMRHLRALPPNDVTVHDRG